MKDSKKNRGIETLPPPFPLSPPPPPPKEKSEEFNDNNNEKRGERETAVINTEKKSNQHVTEFWNCCRKFTAREATVARHRKRPAMAATVNPLPGLQSPPMNLNPLGSNGVLTDRQLMDSWRY